MPIDFTYQKLFAKAEQDMKDRFETYKKLAAG